MAYIVILLFVLISGALAVLAFENFFTEVQLSLFIWQTPAMPLGLLLLLAFILGAFLLYIVSASSALKDARELKRLRKRVGELEQTMASAPTSPLPQEGSPNPPPIVPMPGMSAPDITDMTTLH